MLRRCSVRFLSFNSVATIPLLELLKMGAADTSSSSGGCSLDLSRGAVVCSQSTDIFTNLAIEEALSTGCRFAPPTTGSTAALATSGVKLPSDPIGIAGPILFLYRNSPCVVIGCNQIPWREANVPFLESGTTSATLARRNSGGGAVYHDFGNLCLSFITHRKAHDPPANMAWLAAALKRISGESGLATSSTDRHDLFIDGKKVSGSAMKLMRATAYHHCTLLVDSDLTTVSRSLRGPCPKDNFSDTPCVDSVRSPVTSIATSCAPAMVKAKHSFSTIAPSASEALGFALADDWRASVLGAAKAPMVAITDVDASAATYADLTARKAKPVVIAATLEKTKAWDWRYGHTSRFTCDSGSFDLSVLDCTARLRVQVKKGTISMCEPTVTSCGTLSPLECDALQAAITAALVGRKLQQDSLRDETPFAAALEKETGTTGAVVATRDEAPTLWADILQQWASACGWWPTDEDYE